MEVRHRKRKDTGIHEPLLSDDLPSSHEAEDATREQQSYAIVPRSVNRVDWEALWLSLANACKVGWSNVLSTISNCLATILPLQPQATPLVLSEEQKQRLERLQERVRVAYNKSDQAHQEALKQLWGFAFPGEACTSMVHPKWTEMGWQQNDPSTDFRGAGFIALENLLYLAQNQPHLFRRLVDKSEGTRSDWEYPFAVAGVNLTFTLEEILGLRSHDGSASDQQPNTPAGRAFLVLLDSDAEAFEKIYCVAFEMLDRVWLEMRASYMDFSVVMARVKSQLLSALNSQPQSLEGLFALLQPLSM